jgi:hypothetical protein
MSLLCIELLRGIFTLLAVILGAFIALRVYFRQKEYELAKQRYLEAGVDVVAAELEQALGVVSHNYARSLSICISLRDAGADFDIKEIDRGFIELDSSHFKQIAHHRIGSLVNSQLIWEIFQLAMAHSTFANSQITKVIPEAIRIKLTTNRISKEYESLAEAMMAELKKIHDDGFKFAILLKELHVLGLLLEAEALSLKDIAKFHKRPEIKQLLERLETAFPKETSTIISSES